MSHKLSRVLVAFLFLPLFLSTTGCSQSCADQTEEYRAEVDALFEQWQDTVEVAGSTSRIGLAGPISDMQAVRREVNQLEVPECAQEAHDLLIQTMDDTTDAFLAFSAQEEESRVMDMFDIAGIRLESFEREYGRLETKE